MEGNNNNSISNSINNQINDARFVWVDLEMTGLDPSQEVILEIAVLITDNQMNVIAEGPRLVISQPESILEEMNDWCKEHHGESGLIAEVRESDFSIIDAKMQVLDFIKQHCKKGKAYLAGNSIHMDRMFLHKYMPEILEYLHYRILDVSSFKVLRETCYPDVLEFEKKKTHRALDDIKESIAELKYYQEKLFK
jgi:oligoribonuclease